MINQLRALQNLLLRAAPAGSQGLPSALASPPFSPWHPASLFLGASTSSQARGLTIFSAALGRPASLSAAAPHAARGPLLARPPAAPLPPLAAGQSPLSPPAQQQVRTNFPTSFPMMPKNTKYRKAFRSMGFNNQIAPNTRQPRYGKYALRALGMGRVPANTIEVCRRDMRRRLPKGAMLWIRCYPSVPVSKKPLETRMGRGKGGVEFWACAVRPGQMIFELDNVTEAEAKEAFRVAGSFLPMKTGFVEWK